MPIVQQGAINTTALLVPDLYVQIVPPQNLVLNGVPTNIVGIVGTASWGPVNQPVVVGTMADYVRNLGPVMPRKFDIGTQIATAIQQGAQDFRCVRVTDGTDTAAEIAIPGTTVTFTALHTGSLGNLIGITLQTGSKVGTWRLTVTLPGLQPEVYDNITGSGASFWQALAAAVNDGQGARGGRSQLVVVNAGGATAAPVQLSLSLGTSLPGTDGATSITAATLVGVDGPARVGMYALRGQGCSIGVLADTDDWASWSTQAAFGLDEGVYMIAVGPSNQSVQDAVALKNRSGVDNYSVKLLYGDWLWWSDQVNNIVRLVSPQGFTAGRLANLSPEQSGLNKPIYSIIGSQQSGDPGSSQVGSYSTAELGLLLGAGLDVICRPQPGGSYWGLRGGHNTSTNAGSNGDNYTRLTNYIAATLSSGMGKYIGQVANSDLFRRIRATLLSFLQNMLDQGLLGSSSSTGSLPFSVICDWSNNPQSRVALGYVQADVQIQYQSINEKFIVNLEGGQSVQVTTQMLPTDNLS
jgi:phage tail sheath protein FI